MEKYIYLGIGAVALILLIFTSVRNRVLIKRNLKDIVRSAFGSVPERTYTAEELKKIARFHEWNARDGRFVIDDITANDLDLDRVFGLINQTFSSAGEDVLYALLREPVTDKEELRERDDLIRLMDEDQELREALSAAFLEIGRTRRYSLVDYLDNIAALKEPNGFVLWLPLALFVLSVTLIFIDPVSGLLALIAVSVLNMIRYYRIKGKIEPYYISLQAVAYLARGAKKVLLNEHEKLLPYLKKIREGVKTFGAVEKGMFLLKEESSGSAMEILQVILDYFRMATHLDFIAFYRMAGRVRSHEEDVLTVFSVMGFLEAMIAAASFRRTLPYYCTGSHEGSKGFRLLDGYHILLKSAVPNSIEEDGPVLITGSNASGKSTFLRMSALSALLSETLATVPAKAYDAPFFRIYSSMALRDDIISGSSYYMTEIRSIKRIMDAVEEPGSKVLCFVDEVLRGTNTVERIAASSHILKMLADKGAFVFAATHDIELTGILAAYYRNYHFTEEMEDGEITFSYKLLPGKSETRNAIRLLDLMGYDKEVVKNAEKMAEDFMKEGVWQNFSG